MPAGRAGRSSLWATRGRHALYAAHALHEAGISVDLLVLLDVGGAPGAARRQTRRQPLPAPLPVPSGPVRLESGAAPAVENIDLSSPDSPIDARGLHDITIAASLAVRAFVVGRVRLVTGKRP
jgi:hypothetical protein